MKKNSKLRYEEVNSDEKIKQYLNAGIEEDGNFFELLTEINNANDHRKTETINRIVEIMKDDYGYPPGEFCWLSMGSSGRKEQLFRTDQDNAIIYSSYEDIKYAAKVYRYFEKFSALVNEEFEKLGFDLCPGNVMAMNKFWRGDIKFWLKRTEEWIRIPDGENIRNLTIFLDFRCVYGQNAFAEKIRKKLTEEVKRNPLFLKFLAADACKGKIPLGFMDKIVTLKEEEHKGEINIKTQLLVYIIDCLRVFAVMHSCEKTNTLERIDFLEEKNVISPELAFSLTEALETLMKLKLKSSGNYLNVEKLEEYEKDELVYAMKNISILINIIKEEFSLY